MGLNCLSLHLLSTEGSMDISTLRPQARGFAPRQAKAHLHRPADKHECLPPPEIRSPWLPVREMPDRAELSLG